MTTKAAQTSAPQPLNLRYIIIAYDKDGVTVFRLAPGARAMMSVGPGEVLCQGSSFGDVVKALEQAFTEEMKS